MYIWRKWQPLKAVWLAIFMISGIIDSLTSDYCVWLKVLVGILYAVEWRIPPYYSFLFPCFLIGKLKGFPASSTFWRKDNSALILHTKFLPALSSTDDVASSISRFYCCQADENLSLSFWFPSIRCLIVHGPKHSPGSPYQCLWRLQWFRQQQL